MSNYEEIVETSAAIEELELAKEKIKKKTPMDYFSLAVTTFGIGYLPIAPGTFGSIVGVLIYLGVAWAEENIGVGLFKRGWGLAQISAWISVVNLVTLVLFCLLGIWACNRAVKIFQDKDPQKAVVDEVMGQLLVFLFVPFGINFYFVLAGFLLFRLFDIWKPYPIDSLQGLPAGIGVCADDLVAGVYGGICLSIIYAISLSF